MTQSIYKQIGTLSAIEPELHLFQIGGKVLCAESMPCTHDAALEQREGGFDSISVNVSHGVDAGTVVNLFVVRPLGFTHSGVVRGCIISEDYFHVFRDVLADILCKGSTFSVSGMEEAQIAVALADADDYFFVVVLCDMALAAIHAADVGNVHLYLAVEHRLIGLRHGMSDAMAEIPRGLVAHSDRALNLAGRHALLRFTEQVRSQKPLAEWQMRIVEYRAGCDGELVVTIFAVEELLVGIQLDHRAFAAQALRAFGKAETDQELAALIFGAKQGIYIN